MEFPLIKTTKTMNNYRPMNQERSTVYWEINRTFVPYRPYNWSLKKTSDDLLYYNGKIRKIQRIVL